MTSPGILASHPFNTSSYWEAEKFKSSDRFFERESFVKPFAKVVLATSLTAAAIGVYYVSAVPIAAASLTFIFGAALYMKDEFPNDTQHNVKIEKDSLSSNILNLDLITKHGEPLVQYHLNLCNTLISFVKFNICFHVLSEKSQQEVSAKFVSMAKNAAYNDISTTIGELTNTLRISKEGVESILAEQLKKCSVYEYQQLSARSRVKDLNHPTKEIVKKLIAADVLEMRDYKAALECNLSAKNIADVFNARKDFSQLKHFMIHGNLNDDFKTELLEHIDKAIMKASFLKDAKKYIDRTNSLIKPEFYRANHINDSLDYLITWGLFTADEPLFKFWVASEAKSIMKTPSLSPKSLEARTNIQNNPWWNTHFKEYEYLFTFSPVDKSSTNPALNALIEAKLRVDMEYQAHYEEVSNKVFINAKAPTQAERNSVRMLEKQIKDKKGLLHLCNQVKDKVDNALRALGGPYIPKIVTELKSTLFYIQVAMETLFGKNGVHHNQYLINQSKVYAPVIPTSFIHDQNDYFKGLHLALISKLETLNKEIKVLEEELTPKSKAVKAQQSTYDEEFRKASIERTIEDVQLQDLAVKLRNAREAVENYVRDEKSKLEKVIEDMINEFFTLEKVIEDMTTAVFAEFQHSTIYEELEEVSKEKNDTLDEAKKMSNQVKQLITTLNQEFPSK
ncbi:MAG: hypothetical protein WC222_02540 [Parachlamydiales bacterium]|jgi:hypothetical protein